MANFCVREKDFLNVYWKEHITEGCDYAKEYIKFINLKDKSNIRKFTKKFKVSYNCLLHWNRKDRVPMGIKCLNFLKNKNLLPFYPNEKIARIIGFLHGDGWLCNSLSSFGFSSSNLGMLKLIKNDVEDVFKIKGKIEKERNKNDVVVINGKISKATKPTYHLEFNSIAICLLLYKLGVPKGKKVYQKYPVPKWIVKSNKQIKRAFLHGLFDSELCNSSISSYKNHKDNVSGMRMQLCKEKRLQTDLTDYLKQIKNLLKNFGVESSIHNLIEYRKGMISLTLVISNKLKNIYDFIKKIGFYYSEERKQKSLKIKNLILNKIKKNNNLFMVLNYIKDKQQFTTKDLISDLSLSKSSSNFIGKYLYKYNFADRKRRKDRWFDYHPKDERIRKILNNPILLVNLPTIKSTIKND